MLFFNIGMCYNDYVEGARKGPARKGGIPMMNTLEKALSYTSTKQAHEKIFALAAKAGPDTVFLFYTAEALREQLEAHNTTLFRFGDSGIRWAGPQVMKAGRYHFAALRFTGVKWNGWEVGKNGYMSDAQELAICEALNSGKGIWDKGGSSMVTFKTWTWTGHDHRRGISDLLADDGSIALEVGGIGKRLQHS